MSLLLYTIAEQNDEFRSMIGIPQFGAPLLEGKCLLTLGIRNLPPVTQIEIIAAVRDFHEFTEDNDTYGEHDFGSFDDPVAGKIFWKIDYYDRNMQFGSPDPADPKVTMRLLTIMLASEY